MDTTNREVIEILSNMSPIDEGEKTEYIIDIHGKLNKA